MEELRPAISKLEKQLDSLLREVAETKRGINLLLKIGGQPPRYTDIDSGASSTMNIKPDEYYGQALSSVVGDILARSKACGGSAMSVNEIYQAMVKGGYKFETDSEENAKRGLRISLTKNSAKFHKLPGGTWGLREWYPNVKPERVLIGGENGSVKAAKPTYTPDIDDDSPVITEQVEKKQAPEAEA